ncbi:von Willebrand factor D and EGF domain-containing protein isoform X1 [Hydra vulgaris]|uniref:von Willebrand factor D and EGF domain-containing protein isoform X1 n=1 Tax=Hydra vulgaris TaxID=6087 RepID=UPI001F5F87EE|nr:von Willebrand factor D and EGF domain-containing protein isoform X1 [Hydra vulgaris]
MDNATKILMMVLVFFLLSAIAHAQDSCFNYKTIDDFQRSTAFKIAPYDPSACDRPFSADWYRFTSGAGGKIPTINPPPYSCGVKYPVWLNGEEPSAVGEIKSIQACVVVDENPCAKKINVKVKKCLQINEEYFVYYLKALPGCPMRYCAGTKKKCGPEESSATGFEPCSSSFPKIDKDPVVTVGVKDKRVSFSCKFNTVKESNARYEVTWFQGPVEKQIKGPEIFTNEQNEAFLQNTNKYGENETFCLGYNIYCKLRSYYVGNENLKSRERKSNEFFAGFQVNPKTLDLSEKDKPQKVSITSTVPIVCGDGTENCFVSIELGQDNEDSFLNICDLHFKPGQAGQTQEVEVVAKRDFVDDGNQRMFLKIFVPDQLDALDWNCHKKISDVEIKTSDVRTSRCHSSGDPHITTFDRFYHDHYYVGDYVLVESKSRKFRVHAQTFAWGSVAGNCGVAAQEGDDVIVIDMCRDNVPRARFASTVEPQHGTILTRDNNGKYFMIKFPSGAYVKFDTDGFFANIEIQVPSDDFQNTEGLCGTFDNNPNNDLKPKGGQEKATYQDFQNSWKLTSAESLFYFEGGPRKCTATRAKTYCICYEPLNGSQRKVECNFEGYVDRPKYESENKGWKTLEFFGAEHCGRRKRRSMDDNVVILPDDGNTGIYDYNPVQVSGRVPNFPTKSGITESIAKGVCKDKIRNSIIGRTCIDFIGPSFVTDSYEQQCVIDIQVTDNEVVSIESAVNNLMRACEELTLRNLSFWMTADGKVAGPPTKIAESLCPNECNGNGACHNGTCVCYAGFITGDCSMKEGQPPILFGTPVFCDIRSQDCIRTRLIGKDFIDSSSLSCKMTEVKVSEVPYKKTIKAFINKGQLLSFAEISCLLPTVPVNIEYSSNKPGKPVGGYAISVSNNNQNFSDNETLFLVYDSKCMECTNKDIKSCKWKDNSCKINEYCFVANETNPEQWCEVCNPVLSRNSFSKRIDNLAPSFKKDTPRLYALKGQQWRFVVPAFDPENYNMRYEFEGKNHGMKISSIGIITWSPDKIGNYSFVVKVTDLCGLSSSRHFEVEIVECFCEGKIGGGCIWQKKTGNMSSSECQCLSVCTGEGYAPKYNIWDYFLDIPKKIREVFRKPL